MEDAQQRAAEKRTVSLNDLLGPPRGERAGEPAAGARAEEAQRAGGVAGGASRDALSDTMSSHGTGEGSAWPAGAVVRMAVQAANRWGLRASAQVQIGSARMSYSQRREYAPSDLLDLVYDEADSRALLLHLRGRSRPKRLLCADEERRGALASWLAAWKVGMHPDRFRDFSARGNTAPSAPAPAHAAPRGRTGAGSAAPSGRSGAVVLGAAKAPALVLATVG